MDSNRMQILLERHRLGELDPRHLREVQDYLATPEGRRRLEALEADDERTLLALPPAAVAREVRRRERADRFDPKPERAWMRWALVPAAMAAVATLLVVARWPSGRTVPGNPVPGPEAALSSPGGAPEASDPSRDEDFLGSKRRAPEAARKIPPANPEQIALATVPPSERDDGLRTKGEVRRLRIHRIDPDGASAVSLADGASARPGDVLQVGLLRGSSRWAAVLSIDGGGRVTRHLPETGEGSIPVEDALEAPHSFQLDSAPGFERFVLFLSDRPFRLADAEQVLSRVRDRQPLRLPEGWTAESIFLSKSEARP